MAGLEELDGTPRRTRSSTFSPVWNYFTKGTKSGQFYEATCNFCNHHFTWGKAGEMISHIRNKCLLAPAEAKNNPELIQGPPKPRKSNTPRRAVVQEAVAAYDDSDHADSPLAPPSSHSHGPLFHRRSRPRKPVWDFFQMGKSYHNSHAAKCRYCGKEYASGIPEAMVNHLIKSCPAIPEDIKEAFISDPSGQTARQLIAASGVKLENDVEWDAMGTDSDPVSQLLNGGLESEPAESQSAKKTQKTLAEGRKPGTGQAGMGRSRNTVWEHFNTGTKRGYFYEIFCKYCGYTTQTGVPVKMVDHLKTRCPKVPEHVKNQEFYRPDRHSSVGSTTQTNGNGAHARSANHQDRASSESESGDLKAVTRAVGLAAVASYSMKRESDNGLPSRTKRLRAPLTMASLTMLSPVPRATAGVGVDKEKFHQSLSRYIVMCGIPVATLEHPAFRQLLLTVNPSLSIPSPQYLSEVITECEIIRIDSLTDAHIEAAVYVTIGLKLIGDPSSCQLVVMIVSCIDEKGQKRSFIRNVSRIPDFSSLVDAAGEAYDGSSRWIGDRVNEQMQQIGSQKIVAIVFDSTDRIPALELPRSIPVLPCLLHFFENFLSNVLKHKFVADLADSCQRISVFVNTDTAVQEKLSEFGFQLNLTFAKSSAAASIPLVMFECMQQVLGHGDAIRKAMMALFGELDESDAESVTIPYVMEFVGSDEFWTQLDAVISLVAPVVAGLMAARKQTITLADAFYFLLAHGKRLTTSEHKGLVSLPADLNRACILNLNAEFAKIDSSSLRLSYVLHPLYRGDGLFDVLPDDLLVEAGEWSKSMSRTAEQTIAMIKKLRRYKSRLPPFNQSFRATDSPGDILSWWQRLSPDTSIELSQLAIRVLAISPVNVLAGPEFGTAVFNRHLMSMSPEMVGKYLQLQHFYHVNADEEFRDLKAVFGSLSNVEKLSELVRVDDESTGSRPVKDEQPDSDMSDEEEEVALYLDTVVNFTNPVFDSMPTAWVPPKATLKLEEAAAPVASSEEYDVRQLVMGTSEE